MTIDYTTLQRAIQRLKEALDKYEKYKTDAELGDTVRDSLVKRFEFTLEQSLKMIDRTLKETGFSRHQREPRKQLLRTARDEKLISDFEQWNTYVKSRTISAHDYSEDAFNATYITVMQAFYLDTRQLLQTLQDAQQSEY